MRKIVLEFVMTLTILVPCCVATLCPCFNVVTNQITWGEFLCWPENSTFLSNPFYSGDPADQRQLAPSFCPQTILNCTKEEISSRDACGVWAIVSNCFQECSNGANLWKRYCFEKSNLKAPCPLLNSTAACKSEACFSNRTLSRNSIITNPTWKSTTTTASMLQTDQESIEDDLNSQERSKISVKTTSSVLGTLSNTLSPFSNADNETDTSSKATFYTKTVTIAPITTKNFASVNTIGGYTTHDAITRTSRSEMLNPQNQTIFKISDSSTATTQSKVATIPNAESPNNTSTHSNTIQTSQKQFTEVTVSESRNNTNFKPTTAQSQTITTEQVSTASSSQLLQNETVKTTQASTETTTKQPHLSSSIESKFLNKNATGKTTITATHAQPQDFTQDIKETEFFESTTSKATQASNRALGDRRGNESRKNETNIDEHSHTSLNIIKISLGIVGSIGWLCFISACVLWKKKMREKKTSRPVLQRSLTTASGVYESVGPALPPPRDEIYLSMAGVFYEVGDDNSNAGQVHSGVFQAAEDMYIDPATLPRNKPISVKTNPQNDANYWQTGRTSSKVTRISHSEFHLKGYLSPVHLCPDKDAGYVSFNVSDVESNPMDQSERNLSNAFETNSDAVFEENETQSTPVSRTNDTTNNENSQDVPHYEKKHHKSFHKIRRKNRPNLRVLLKRTSSKELADVRESSVHDAKTPQLSVKSPRTPQVPVSQNSQSEISSSKSSQKQSSLTKKLRRGFSATKRSSEKSSTMINLQEHSPTTENQQNNSPITEKLQESSPTEKPQHERPSTKKNLPKASHPETKNSQESFLEKEN